MGHRLSESARSPASVVRPFVIALFSIGSGWVLSAHAARLTYSVGYDWQYSNNIFQTEHDRASDSISSLLANFVYQEALPDAQTRLRLGATYRNYHRDSFDDESTFLVDGAGEWFFLPRLLSWVATEGFRQVQVSPIRPNTPDNLEDSNVFTTGPNLYLHLGPRDQIVIEGRYGDVYIANSDLDNRRSYGALRWVHQVSQRQRVSANYEYMEVEFKEVNTYNYSRHDAYLSAVLTSNRTEFQLEVGGTQVDLVSGESLQGFRGRIDMAQQLSSHSRAGIRYFQDFSDTGLELLATGITSAPGNVGGSGNVTTDVVTGDVFYSKQSELYYRRTVSTLPFGIRVFMRDVDFEIDTGDRREKGGTIDVNYSPIPMTTLSLFSFYRLTEYFDTGREDRDSESGVAVVWQMGRRLSSRLEFRNISRHSAAVDASFDDSRVTISISYGTSPIAVFPTASIIR